VRNPSFEDAPSEVEKKKQQAAAANSNWKKFLDSAPGRFVSGYAEGMANAFTGPGSIGENVPKAIRAGAGVVERNPALQYLGQAILAPTINAAAQGQVLIEEASRQGIEFQKENQRLVKEKYEDLKKNDPTNPKLKIYEELVNNPPEIKEPIQNVEDTATALTEFYDSYHQGAAKYLLRFNPDIIKASQEENQNVWDTAEAYSKEVSFGQSLFDLTATTIDSDSMFDIDITDPEQRNYMFYEGDGFVGGLGKKTSGAADLSLQLFGDPFWLAGKGAKAARLGLINVTTTQEAEKGVRKLWQQSYFVDGKEGIAKYNEGIEKFAAIDDEIIALKQERLGFQTERDLYKAQIDNPAPGQVVNVEANSINVEILDEHLAKLDTQIDAKILEGNAALPKLTRGHDEFHNQLQYMTVDQIADHPRFERYGAMRTRLAEAYYLAAKSGDKRNLIDLDLIAMGVDGTAAERMRARSASLMTIIEDQKVVLKKFTDDAKIMAGEIDSAAAKEIYAQADDDAFKLYQAYVEESAFLRAAVAQEGQRVINMVGMLDPRGVSRFRTVEKARANRAKTRADLRFDNLSFTNLGRSIYVGRPLYGATERYRPNNMVTIEGIDQADGYDEFVAWLQKAGSNRDAGALWSAQKVLGKEESDRLAQSFLMANTRAAKEEVLRDAERTFLKTLLINLKVKLPEGKDGDELLDTFIDDWLSFKDEKTSLLRDRAFYVNSEGDNVAMPLLKTELAYSYYMADSTDLAVWAKNNVPQINSYFQGAKKRIAGEGTLRRMTWDLGSEGVQLLDQMWRFGVLARLGYPVRNVGAEWLKFAVIGGMFRVFGPQYTSGRELPAAIKKSVDSWYLNRYAQFERIALDAKVRQDMGIKVSMRKYPEYVEMNNHLRQGEIMYIIGDMDYNAFVKLAEKVRANPGKINDLPEFFEEAYLKYDEIITSQEKLLDVLDRWNALTPEKRNTEYFQMYGYEFEEAYNGTQGMALRNALSSGPTIELMTSGVVQKAKSKEWMGVQAKIQPDDPEYYPNLSNTIGTDYVNSEAAKEIIRVSIADPSVQGIAREEAIQKFATDAALRDEIFATGRYQLYKAEIKEEQKALKDQLKTVQEKTKKLIVLSDDDLDTLNAGRLPEKFGPASPEYQKAVKKEKKRLTDEFQMDPDYVQKVENTGSELGLSANGRQKLAKDGLISLRAIRYAIANGRLSLDEVSAMLSTGNIESAAVGGAGYEMYRFYTLTEIENLSVTKKGGKYFQVPWAQASAEDYVDSGLRNFENNYYATRVEDLLTEHEIKTEAVTRLGALRKQVDDPENLSIEELLELGIKVPDERSIEERYFDEIYEVITRYLPSADLRAKILTLKAGETIPAERLRFELGRTGEALSPITGDLLISEEKIRALANKLADDYAPQGSVEAKLDSWLLRKKSIPEKRREKFVSKNEEELVRAEEANKRLGALDEKASAKVVFNRFRQNVFRYIGQIPEDNLVKWPFGKVAYNNHIESVAQNWYKSGFEPTQADLYALHTSARARAISESRKYLYSAQRKLTGPGNVPFLAPFYQAAIIGSKNWARVAWNDPSIIARRAWMYNYINEHADYDKRNGNRTLTLRLPGWLIDSIEALPGDQSAYKGALKAFPNMKFNINSFNLMFPGMRLGMEGDQTKATVTSVGGSLFEAVVSSIGAGPLVTIGVETLVKMNPSIDQDIYERTGRVTPIRSILDKISPTENITADPNWYDLLPPVAKRGYALMNGVNSAEYARINMQLFMTYVHRMETGEMERVPLSEIEQQVANETAALITIKGIANLTLPAIPQFEGEVNKMINIYREYQDTHKEKADTEFIEDYPDWYVVSSTMSKNKGGVLSTIDSQKMSEKHTALINNIDSLGGEGIESVGSKFIGMLVNREGQPTEFDPASRVWLIEEEMYGRFGSGKTAVEQSMIQKGNQDYFKQKDFRDEQIKLHGTSIGKPNLSSRNTSDPTVVALNADFENFVNRQYENNPIWWTQEWEPKAMEKVQPTAIRAMRIAIADKAWMADQAEGNWTEQLSAYLELQKEYSTAYQGATSDMDKRQIKELFQLDIDTLVSKNETFAYYYERFFDGKDGEPYLELIPE
jgi:hypothetical protein